LTVKLLHMIQSSNVDKSRVDILKKLYYHLCSDGVGDHCDTLSSPALLTLQADFHNLTDRLNEDSRTAKLRLTYMKNIQTIRMFLFAEHTSNWQLHLECVKDMLNLFACTGHTCMQKAAAFTYR